jgi:hypothetical protein
MLWVDFTTFPLYVIFVGEEGLFISGIPEFITSFYKGTKEMNEKKLVRNAFKDGDVFFNFGDIFFLDKQYYIYFRDRVGDTFRYNKFIDMALWFMIYGASRHFQQYFSYIVAVSFIGGRNRNTRRKPPTCRKSLTNFIT